MPRFPVAGITKLSELDIDAALDMDGHNIALDGGQTVDGLDCSGVEAGATADQTGAEIKTAYQAQANAYTDAKNTKLASVDTGADVTANNAPKAHKTSHEAGGSDSLRKYFLSDDVLISNDGVVTTTTGFSTPNKTKGITLTNTPDTIRISFAFAPLDSGSSGTVYYYAQIYRNGGAVGTQRSLTGTLSYTTYSEDISGWSDGDELEIYVWSNYNNFGINTKELRILGKYISCASIINSTNNDA